MRFKNLLFNFKFVRFKTNQANTSNEVKLSNFTKNLRRRFIHDSYFDLEDNYKRLSRSTKVSYYALGLFIFIPSTLAWFSPPTPTYVNLLSHQFKLSSVTLSWISSNYLAFNISKFGNTSFLSNTRGFVGLLFTVLGVTGALVIGDYSLINGLYTLMSSYCLLGFYNYLLTTKQLLPRCIFIPSTCLILFNILTLGISLIKSYSIKNELHNISDEEIIRKFESTSKFKKSLNKLKDDKNKPSNDK